MTDKYVAYIGSYTFHGNSKGISIMDVDMEKGRMTKRKEIEVNNSAALTVSADGRFLYSIVDEGIAAFQIEADGELTHINTSGIKGMRGCYVSVDSKNEFIFTAGYHDGKATVLRLRPDGGIGEITAEVYDRGLGSVAERNFRPHVSCAHLTPDEKYLLVSDLGIDQIKVYRLNRVDGSLHLIDIIRCELESAPRELVFSHDGRHMYVICELKNYIVTYNYFENNGKPIFEFKQLVSSLPRKSSSLSAACCIKMGPDGNHVFSANAGDDSVGIFNRDEETGLLYQQHVLPISGEYPKKIMIFPDGNHLASLNHDSNEISFFHIQYDTGILVMNGLPIRLDSATDGIFVKLPQ